MFVSKKRTRDEDEDELSELGHTAKAIVRSLLFDHDALLLIALEETGKPMHSPISNLTHHKACTGILTITTDQTSTAIYTNYHTGRFVGRRELASFRVRS